MTDLTNRAARAAWWSTLEIAARYLVQFLVTIVLARLLSPADFGLVAMLLVFTSIGAMLVDSGFGTALVQRQSTDADDATTVFIFTTAASVLVAGVLWLSAPAVAIFFAQPALVGLTRVMVVVLPLGAIAAVPDAMLTMKLQFKERAEAEVIASLASAGVAISSALEGAGVWSLVWQTTVQMSIRTILLWVYSGWRPNGRFRWRSFLSLFHFGGFILMSGLLETLSTRLQSFLIGLLFNTQALGLYTVAQNTQQAPMSIIGSLLNRVGLPLFAAVTNQPGKLLGALRRSLRVALFVFIPCMVGMAVIAKPLMGMLYGSRWEPAAPILTLLALAGALWPLHVLNLAALTAQGRSDLFFRLAVVKKTLGIALIIIASLSGPIGIAWAVLASNLISAVINAHYSRRLLGYGIFEQVSDQRGTFGLSLLAAVAGWAILHWTKSSLGSTLLAVAVAGAVYLGTAAITRNAAFLEFLSLARALNKPDATLKIEP